MLHCAGPPPETTLHHMPLQRMQVGHSLDTQANLIVFRTLPETLLASVEQRQHVLHEHVKSCVMLKCVT